MFALKSIEEQFNMIIKTTEQIMCECGEEITLYEYEGLEGHWYINHFCSQVAYGIEKSNEQEVNLE